jgi:hypothetical protein
MVAKKKPVAKKSLPPWLKKEMGDDMDPGPPPKGAPVKGKAPDKKGKRQVNKPSKPPMSKKKK